MFTRSLQGMDKEYGIKVVAICPSFSPTKLIEGTGIAEKFPLVSIEQVTDAFILAIEDDSTAGGCIRITPELVFMFFFW